MVQLKILFALHCCVIISILLVKRKQKSTSPRRIEFQTITSVGSVPINNNCPLMMSFFSRTNTIEQIDPVLRHLVESIHTYSCRQISLHSCHQLVDVEKHCQSLCSCQLIKLWFINKPHIFLLLVSCNNRICFKNFVTVGNQKKDQNFEPQNSSMSCKR